MKMELLRYPLLFAACLCLLLAFGSACGPDAAGDDDDGAPPPTDDDTPADEDDQGCYSGNLLSYDLTPGEKNIPFPSMVFMREAADSSTGYRLDVAGQVTTYLDPVLEAAGLFLTDMLKMDGFGTTTPVWFHADTPPNTFFLNATGAPYRGDTVLCAVLEDENHPDHGRLWPLDVSYLPDVQLIQVLPHLPFAENTTYMCIIQDNLCTELCDCYEQPDHLKYVMAPMADPTHPEYELLEVYRKNMRDYFQEFFDQYGISRERIISATVFRTQWVSHDLLSIREQLVDAAMAMPPEINAWRRIDSTHPAVDSVWETTYDTIDWRHSGTFEVDKNGDPLPAQETPITLRLTLPKETAAHGPPYPVVLFGHGLMGDRTRCAPIYQTLAANGFATVAIDWVFHGDRAPLLGLLPDYLKLVGQFVAFTPVLSPQRMRDNYRQGVADMMWLKYVVQEFNRLDLAPAGSDGDGVPDLETETIMFAGISMGSAHGTILAALEPEIDTFCLMSGAANWRTSILGDDNIDGFMVWMIAVVLEFFDEIFHFENESDVALFYQLQMAVGEAGDPYSYARHVLDNRLTERTRQVDLLHMMPAADNITGALGEAELARSIGTTLLRPFVWRIDEVQIDDTPFIGPATFQYDTDNHVFMRQPDAEYFAEGHHQMGKFFKTAYQEGRAVVVNPFK